MSGPPGPPRSPDGLAWWDGQAWQPIASLGVPPPAPPPAAPFPEGAPEPQQWPEWLPRTRAAEAVVDNALAQSEAPPPPRPAPAAPGPPGEMRTLGWEGQLTLALAWLTENRKLAMIAGLAILGLIVLYTIVQIIGQAGVFGGSGGTATTDQGPTGSQYQQADGFLSGSLSPALASVAAAISPVATDCGGTFSVTCRNTLENADTAAVKAIAVIDRGPFPVCVATPVVQTRQDLVTLEQGIKSALIGFRENSQGLITKGLAQLNGASPPLKADGDALKAAQQSPACPR